MDANLQCNPLGCNCRLACILCERGKGRDEVTTTNVSGLGEAAEGVGYEIVSTQRGGQTPRQTNPEADASRPRSGARCPRRERFSSFVVEATAILATIAARGV